MLPTLSVPEFTTILPSTGDEIRFRPFLVKEEKILLIALEDGESKTIVRAVVDLLKNCIIDDVDVESLPTFDIEYLFMQVRSKSVGETIEMVLSHGADKECRNQTKHLLNIEDIKVTGQVDDGKIKLDEKIGVKVKYPSYSRNKTIDRNAENLFVLIRENIEYVYDDDNIYDEFSEEEMMQWLEHLNSEQFEKILSFFTRGPSLRHVIEWECPECKEKDYAVMEGLKDFFMLV